MKFFIDTGITEEIKEAQKRGWVDGVTTNPSLVAKAGKTHEELIKEICEVVEGPVSAEVLSLEAEGMISEGLELAKLGQQVVVKIPMGDEGMIAVRELASKGIKTNVTLVFSALQALLAAKAGASFVSPFVGRLDDIGSTGMVLIEEIRTIYDNYGFDTEILVASVRHPQHILEAALIGADVVTVPYGVLAKLSRHPLTQSGLDQFMKDAQKSIHT